MSRPISRDKSASKGPPARTPSIGSRSPSRKSLQRASQDNEETPMGQVETLEVPQLVTDQEEEVVEGAGQDGVAQEELSRGASGHSESKASEAGRSEKEERDPEKDYDTDIDIDVPPLVPVPVVIGEEKESYDKSWEQIYDDVCKKESVVPVSYFLRHLRDEELIMRHHGLGVKGARTIAVALVSNTCVNKLDLSDNNLEDKGCLAIAEMLKDNYYISDLSLCGNSIGREGVLALCEVLQSNPTLTHLTLRDNNLDDVDALRFADAILKATKIECLDLSHNRFGDKSAEELSNAISENTSIRHLDLSWNNFRAKGVSALAKGIKTNVVLKKCNLSWNGAELEGAQQLCECLKGNSTLEYLDLTNCRINTESAVVFAKGLAVNEALKVLKIGKNPLESAGCYGIITQVIANPQSVLEEIYFDDILVNKDFDEQHAKLLEAYPDIKVFTGGSEEDRKKKPPAAKMHPLLKVKKWIELQDIKLIDLFSEIDKDGTMRISKEEFVEAMKKKGLTLTDEEIAIVIATIDKDMSGEINYREFHTFVSSLDVESNALVQLRIVQSFRGRKDQDNGDVNMEMNPVD